MKTKKEKEPTTEERKRIVQFLINVIREYHMYLIHKVPFCGDPYRQSADLSILSEQVENAVKTLKGAVELELEEVKKTSKDPKEDTHIFTDFSSLLYKVLIENISEQYIEMLECSTNRKEIHKYYAEISKAADSNDDNAKSKIVTNSVYITAAGQLLVADMHDYMNFTQTPGDTLIDKIYKRYEDDLRNLNSSYLIIDFLQDTSAKYSNT